LSLAAAASPALLPGPPSLHLGLPAGAAPADMLNLFQQQLSAAPQQ
jgi:hypothetical protein